ncbi:MAG: hypothetical protein ACKOC5_19390, partial [Chloroflexota bacterium]
MLVGNRRAGSTLPVSGLRVPTGNLRQQLRRYIASSQEFSPLQQVAAQAIDDWFGTAYTTADALRAGL